MGETVLMRDILVELSKIPGCVFWRNNVGFDEMRKIRYGLAVGSGDLIGMIDGVFCSIEVKTKKGRVSAEQEAWRRLILQSKGYAMVVRSVQEAIDSVNELRSTQSVD